MRASHSSHDRRAIQCAGESALTVVFLSSVGGSTRDTARTKRPSFVTLCFVPSPMGYFPQPTVYLRHFVRVAMDTMGKHSGLIGKNCQIVQRNWLLAYRYTSDDRHSKGSGTRDPNHQLFFPVPTTKTTHKSAVYRRCELKSRTEGQGIFSRPSQRWFFSVFFLFI